MLPGEGTDLSAPLSLGASVSEQPPAWACASPAMTQDGLDSADTTSALAYLRMLSAEPDAAKLRSLHEALDSQPPSSSWFASLLALVRVLPLALTPTLTPTLIRALTLARFASFLALDGAQALLDVLSHSQVRG